MPNVPGVPVLVIDDCSADTTVSMAGAAGAHVLILPHHLGLGGCVQTGYKTPPLNSVMNTSSAWMGMASTTPAISLASSKRSETLAVKW